MFFIKGIDGTNIVEPLKTVIMQTDLNMITQLCMVFSALCPFNVKNMPPLDLEVLECAFVQSIYSSLGATLVNEDARKMFDGFMKKQLTLINIEDTPENPANCTQMPTAKPSLYEYFFDLEQRAWIAWEWIVPAYIHDKELNFSDILVPTVDTLRTEFIISMMYKVCYN